MIYVIVSAVICSSMIHVLSITRGGKTLSGHSFNTTETFYSSVCSIPSYISKSKWSIYVIFLIP